MRWSGTVDSQDIETLPAVPLRLTVTAKPRRRVRYRVKAEFWAWLFIAGAYGFIIYQVARAVRAGWLF